LLLFSVFVDGTALNVFGDSGPHQRFSAGLLFDSIQVEQNGNADEGQINFRNRASSGSGHGWTAHQCMLWNTEAEIIAAAPNGGMNYAIGNVGTYTQYDSYVQEPRGIVQSLGSHVTPRSLYYTQLKDRLGSNAMNSQLIPAQKVGHIWNELQSWYGDGLFMDPVVVWYDEGVDVMVDTAHDIFGHVRDLNLMESSPSIGWSLTSGPGTVQFSDSSSLSTQVTFSAEGTYIVRLVVGSTTATMEMVAIASSTIII
jgi:hypothetical protein